MSLKNKIAKNMCQSLREVPVIGNVLYVFSNMYIDEYRHFSYDADVNGKKMSFVK